MKVYMKLVAGISTAVAFAALVLLKIFLGGRSRRTLTLLQGHEPCWTSPRQLGLSSGDEFGCLRGENCWAGVYVDLATNEILHLDTGGRAFLSPGTAAADTRWECLRWWAEEDLLHVADRYDQPFIWPGAASDLRRDPVQAGKLAGFGVEDSTKLDAGRREGLAYTNSTHIDQMHLVRDPFGFVFPGCMYALSMRPGSSRGTENSHEARVVVNRDGTITDVASGGRIARWFFQGGKPLPGMNDDSWASGDAVVLLIDTDHYQSRGTATATEDRKILEFKLSSSDGGRTWLPVSGHSEARLRSDHEAYSGMILSLVLPKAVSMFPLTAAVSPLANYLNGDEASDPAQEIADTTATYGKKLQPLVEIFEAQPIRLGGDHGDVPEGLDAIIVISRAVPRPTEHKDDLSCVINGAQTRAVWLSWSMVLCSTAHVKAEDTTVYITFQDRRFSVDFSFLHSPPPRHMRLGWPAMESFDRALRGFSQKRVEVEHAHLREDVMASVSSGGLLGTNLVLCTVFKNEAAYLEEWLQYHQLLGVSKVYLYDNGSSDNSRDLLRKYELSKFVQVRDWPHEGAQTEALNDCLSRFRHAARWMSFIDVDEFIDPAPGLPIQTRGDSPQGRIRRLDDDQIEFVDGDMSARRKRLRNVLEELAPNRHTHCMAWVNYCSYGQRSKPLGGIVDNYHELEDMGERKIHMQKPLFKALESLTLRRIGPHFLLYATEDIAVQYRRNLSCPYEWLDPITFRIRHYRSKSLEEYVQRRTGADSAYKNKRYTKERLELEWHETNAQCGNPGA